MPSGEDLGGKDLGCDGRCPEFEPTKPSSIPPPDPSPGSLRRYDFIVMGRMGEAIRSVRLCQFPAILFLQ